MTKLMKQVLVADDNPELLRIYATVFEMLNCTVTLARDGDETMDMLETMTPDLLVLDVNMPHQTGLDVLRQVREHPEFSATRVMLLTGNVTVLNHPDAEKAEIVLVKPVNVPDLLNSARRLLSQ